MRRFFKEVVYRIYQQKLRIVDLSVLIFFSLFVLHCNKNEKKVIPQVDSDQKAAYSISKYEDTLRRELQSDPHYLNPILTNDGISLNVQELIFDPLLSIDSSPDSDLVGRLAEKWEISADKLKITFHLRQGINWHDGEPFTAHDVKFTFDVAMREDVPAISMKSKLEPLDHVEVLDKYSVTFHFKYPFSPALTRIGTTLILPKHRLNDQGLVREQSRRGLDKPVTFLTTEFNRQPIGTGPYRFHEWNTAQNIRLVRNDNYWDKIHFPQIAKVVFKIIHNRTVSFNVLQKGELDISSVRSIQFLRFQRLADQHENLKAIKFFKPTYTYIAWNVRPEKKIFSDRRVRRAMTHALDRKTYIEKISYGLGHIISGPFYFKSWANNPDVKPIPYDLVKAAQLLREAGWEDSDGDGILDKEGIKFEFEVLLISGNIGYAQLAEILHSNLKKLSIEVQIRVYEWSVFLERTHEGEFDAYICDWQLGIDPDQFSIWHSSQIGLGNNDIGYKNDEVDRLLEAGRREFDREKRQKIYWKIHEIIHHDQPYTFVQTLMTKYVLSKRVQNYQISPFGLFGVYPGQLSWTLKNDS